jgi:hypothetical protein
MLTGSNGIGKTSVLEALYCLCSETRLDVSPLSRYNRTLGFIFNPGSNGHMGVTARQGYNYKLFWDECPYFGNDSCRVEATLENKLKWSWKYEKAYISDLDGDSILSAANKMGLPIDSSTIFAKWEWEIGETGFSSAQILLPDGGLYLSSGNKPLTNSVCRYLDFASIRTQPNKLSFQISKKLTEALQLIYPPITDIRLTGMDGGLSVIINDSNPVSLGAIGNGAVTWASALIAIFDMMDVIDPTIIKQKSLPIIVLIDEFGAGIHYSAMLDIWKYIDNFTQQYPSVQFVVTSHSGDCIMALCEAIPNSKVGIVRLHKTMDGEIIPTNYDREHFKGIASGDWEVRG